MLVWIASYPRSGNTLTMMALRDVFGIGRIGTVMGKDLDLGQLQRALPPANREVWSPPTELANLSRTEALERIRASEDAFFIKTHRISEAEDPAPAIYIVRDGRDALVSQAHFVADRSRFAGQSFDERLLTLIDEGMPTRGTWSANVAAWRRRGAPTAVIHFEDLVRDPPSTVAAAFEPLGLPIPPADGELTSFAEARDRMPDVFRRGEVGSWRDEMPGNLAEHFWELHGEQMLALGYAR